MNAPAVAGVADAPVEGHMNEKTFHDAKAPAFEVGAHSGESQIRREQKRHDTAGS